MELNDIQQLILACGGQHLLYGLFAGRSILALSRGNETMIDIANAIQEGAKSLP